MRTFLRTAAFFVVAILILLAGSSVAFADGPPSAPVSADLEKWITAIGVVLAGVGFLLHGAAKFVSIIAPLTPTKVDDAWPAKLENLAASVDKIGTHIARLFEIVSGPHQAQVPSPEAPTKPNPAQLAPIQMPIAGPGRSRESGRARLTVLVLLAIGAGVTIPALAASGCSGAQRTAIEHGLWDCTAPERAQAVDALTPLATSVILAAASADGHLIDTAKLKAAVSKANLLSDAGQLLTCATVTAFAALMQPHAALAGAPAAAPLELDPGALRAALEVLRAEQFPTATFRTSAGVL